MSLICQKHPGSWIFLNGPGYCQECARERTAQCPSDAADCSASWAVVKGTPDGLLYMSVTEGTPVRMCWSKNVEDAVEFKKEQDAKLVSQVFWDAGSAVAHAPLPNAKAMASPPLTPQDHAQR